MFRYISFRQLLGLLTIIPLLLMVSSCKKDEGKLNGGKAALYSFGPTGLKIGDTIRFIGVNLNQVTSIQFTGQNAIVEKNQFTGQSSELIRLIIPESAEKGFVVLKLADGDTIRTKTQLNLNVLATVAGMTATARPGEAITITGSYLNWIDRITFAKDIVVTNFLTQTASELTVLVPENAQTGTLILHYGGTDSADVETVDTLHVTLPKGHSFQPNPVKHGKNVTIAGTDLDLVNKLYFKGEPSALSTFISQTAAELIVQVPAGAVDGKLILEAASGLTTETDTELKLLMPIITAMSPNPVAPAANVTITGANLDLVASATFVGVEEPVRTFVSQTPTQLVITVPEAAISGKLTLAVLNSTLSVKSSADLSIEGSSVPPIIIYDDALTSAWNGWVGGGWGGSVDVNNSSPVKSGSKSVKLSFTGGGWGVPWQLGGANISLAGYSTFKISVYGGDGADDKTINIGFNEADGKTVTVKGGVWTNFSIPLNEISAASVLTHLYIKNYSASGDFTIYVDNIGIY